MKNALICLIFSNLVDKERNMEKKHSELPAERKTNAEFIVKACNNHYALIEALKGLLDKLKDEYEGKRYIDIRIHDALEAIKQCEE